MIKNKFVLMLLIVFLIPFVVGIETQITIQSEPNADVTLRFLDLNTGRIIDPVSGVFYEKGDGTGKVFVNYNSLDKLIRFSITVQIGNTFKEFDTGINETKTKLAKFNAVEAGREIFINLNTNIPVLEVLGGEVVEEEVVEEEIIEEVTEEATEEVVEEVIEEDSGSITGSVINLGEVKPVIKKIVYFALIIGSIGVIFVIVFAFFKNRGSKKTNSSIKLRDKKGKLELMNTTAEDAELMDAERRIKEAEDEIEDIKTKKSRLREAEKKFEEDKKELEKLKG